VSVAGRKHAAVEAKLRELRAELVLWRGLTDKDGAKLARHWSQVQTVTLSLDSALDEITDALGRVSGVETDAIESCVVLESQVLDVHRAWEYFRGKLAQRFVAPLEAFLLTTDELAWACYRPAQEAFKGDRTHLREPPLTYLNGGANPFVLTRGESIAAAIGDGGVRNERLRALVEILPVPVIGLPWHHLRHVPDAVVVAHEVGHAVEEDFGLAETVRERVTAAVADEERACAWRAWSPEVFADVYATLALGPAYAGALADFAAGGRRTVVTPRPRAAAWGDYPTPTLRVLLSLAVCRRAGCVDAADALLAEWRAAYPEHRLTEWEPDATAVAEALIDSPYSRLGNRTLRRAIRFGAAEWTAAVEESGRLLAGGSLVNTGVRVLVAAARDAFARDPENYAGNGGSGTPILVRVHDHSDGSRRRGRERTAGFDARKQSVDARLLAALDQTTSRGEG
jgi:hypothetical protein